jgi:hypothetical protein
LNWFRFIYVAITNASINIGVSTTLVNPNNDIIVPQVAMRGKNIIVTRLSICNYLVRIVNPPHQLLRYLIPPNPIFEMVEAMKMDDFWAELDNKGFWFLRQCFDHL